LGPPYDAFISYRTSVERDSKVAARLHVALETYQVPRALRKQGFPASLKAVFKDTEELAVSTDLSETIQTALIASRFLIVLCSPETPLSSWIDREIEMFCALGREQAVLLVLIAGTPEESFPKRFRATVPLAANIQARSLRASLRRLRMEKLRLIARIIGCSFDDLWRRQRRRTIRSWFTRGVIGAASAAALSLFLPPSRAIVESAVNAWLNRRISPNRPSDQRATDALTGATTYGVSASLFQYGRYPFLTTVLIPEMIAIPGGTFLMGDASGEADERPHEVELAPFAIGRFEVTTAQFNAYLRSAGQRERDAGPNIPYDSLTWAEADSYCRWVSKVTGHAFRLPTEAEWEYACRAGSQTRFSFGDDVSRLPQHAWYLDNATSGNPREAGAGLPNAFGLFDVHGNVEEWVGDWYAADYYPHSPRSNPKGAAAPGGYPDPFEPDPKITRGGSAVAKPFELRCADRVPRGPEESKNEVGFRCAADSWR
jgi:formylglycine-generating enzyme required for sulfatase activity